MQRLHTLVFSLLSMVIIAISCGGGSKVTPAAGGGVGGAPGSSVGGKIGVGGALSATGGVQPGSVGGFQGIGGGFGGTNIGGSSGAAGAGGASSPFERACREFCATEAQVACPKAPTPAECQSRTCTDLPRVATCALQYSDFMRCFTALGPTAFTCTADGRVINTPEPCLPERSSLAACVN